MAVRGSVNWPPSLKESGVTFTMPITSVRSPSASRRERSCHVNRGRVAMRNSVRALTHAEKELDVFDLSRLFVRRQAVEEDASVGFLDDAVIQQHEDAAIVQRADQPAKALLQRDHRRRDLILVERIAAVLINGLDACRYYGIVRDREREPVDDHAAQLLALHIYSLPERSGSEQHRVRCGAKFFQQCALGRTALQQYWVLEFPEKPVMD